MKVALLIDGGFLRATSQKAGQTYDRDFIARFANHCIVQGEYLLRVFYYDAPLYRGKVKLPVSGAEKVFQASDRWLDDIAKLERFAVRRGTLGFRGWKPKAVPIDGNRTLTDNDFSPIFEQKGVDMRIGLDIANFAKTLSVERIILVSGDQDMIPAMKEARKAGLEVAAIQLPAPAHQLHDQIQGHCDMVRAITWP